MEIAPEPDDGISPRVILPREHRRGFRRINRNSIAVVVVWLIAVATGVITYYQLRNQPFFHDANGYALAARSLADRGLLAKWYISDIRTYGYPLFLAGAFKVGSVLHVGDSTAVFLLQWPIYVGSAWLVATSVVRDRRRQLFAFLSLAANPLLIVYTAQAFTETLSLTCLLFATASLGRASRSDRALRRAAWLVGGALASGYSLAVRPGNLFVPGCYALAAAMVLLWPHHRRRWAHIAFTGIVSAAALAAPLVPQVLINQRNYHITSALPVLDLSKVQTSVGLQLLRYATNVSTTCGDVPLLFLNPDHPDLEMSTVEALRYYGLDWPAGPRAAGLHVFSGLDPRPFLVDQHDFGTGYERWLQGLTVVLLILAAFGVVPAWRRLRRQGLRSQPHVIFLAAVVVFATGILATSAAEYRFGSIPLVAVSVLAALGTSQLLRPRWALAAAFAFAVAMPAWIAVSNYVLSTSTIWQQCS